jgi:hypothetical protein
MQNASMLLVVVSLVEAAAYNMPALAGPRIGSSRDRVARSSAPSASAGSQHVSDEDSDASDDSDASLPASLQPLQPPARAGTAKQTPLTRNEPLTYTISATGVQLKDESRMTEMSGPEKRVKPALLVAMSFAVSAASPVVALTGDFPVEALGVGLSALILLVQAVVPVGVPIALVVYFNYREQAALSESKDRESKGTAASKDRESAAAAFAALANELLRKDASNANELLKKDHELLKKDHELLAYKLELEVKASETERQEWHATMKMIEGKIAEFEEQSKKG